MTQRNDRRPGPVDDPVCGPGHHAQFGIVIKGLFTMKAILRAIGLNKVFHAILRVLARLLNVASPYRKDMRGALSANPSPWVNKIKSILRPHQLRIRQQYGQWPGLPRHERLDRPVPEENEDLLHAPGLDACVEKLNADGYVTMPFSFADEVAEIKARYDIRGRYDCPKDNHNIYTLDPRADKTIMKMLTHPFILALLARKFGCQPCLRHLPVFRSDITDRDLFDENAVDDYEALHGAGAGFAMQWHGDNPNLMHIDIILEDLNENTTHTEIAPGSHKVPFASLDPNYDQGFATGVVKKAFGTASMTGPAGTIYVWNGDALHRMHPAAGTFRSMLIFYATPGNLLFKSNWPNVPLADGAVLPEPADDLSQYDQLTRHFITTGLPEYHGA